MTTNAIEYRASTTGVDVDEVYRSLRDARAVKSWVDPFRLLYRLGQCTVETFDAYHGKPSVLFVSGPTEADARTGMARLGYGQEGVTVTEVHLV
jgi:hypothetical protein